MTPKNGTKLLLAATTLAIAAACLPPHGLGPPPLNIDDGLYQTSFQYGFDDDRQVFQTSMAYTAPVSKAFSLEAGGIYTRISDPAFFDAIQEPRDEIFEERSFDRSGLPYIKPMFHLGPITISIPMSGFALPLSERGGHFAFGGGSIGYSGENLAIHAGGSYHLLHLYSEEGELDSNTWQATFAARYDANVDGGLLGLYAELVYGEHSYQANFNDLDTGLVKNELLMGLVGLDLGWPIDLD